MENVLYSFHVLTLKLPIQTLLSVAPKHPVFARSGEKYKQECIPVGCVPAARRPYAGVCFRGGLPGPEGGLPGPGGSAWSGGCLLRGGFWYREGSAWSGGGLPGLGGRGVGIPACTEADPPCEQNDIQV